LSLYQFAALPAGTNAFIWVLIMGNIGSYQDLTSGPCKTSR